MLHTLSAMLLLLLLSILICLAPHVSAQDESSPSTNMLRLVQGGYRCSGDISGSNLSARFDTLKQVLLARASVALYAKSEDIDPVSGYGASVMYQCRGDLALPDCATCVKTAFGTNPDSACLVSSFLQVELQGCGVIHSNQSLEVGYYHPLTSLVSSANGTSSFFDNRDIAVANVTEQVIENKRNLGTYWAVDVVGDASQEETLCYALAQCHGYLSPSACTDCLNLAMNRIDPSRVSVGARCYLRSCYIRYENYRIYTNSTPSILTSLGPSPSPPPSPLPSPPIATPRTTGKGSNVPFVVTLVVVVGAVLFVAGSLLGCFLHHICTHKNSVSNQLELRKLNGVTEEDTRGLVDFQHEEDTRGLVDFQHDGIQYFSLSQLEKATDKFHPENKIGEGGFGVVYLGILDNGVKVAIKKLIQMSNSGKEKFLSEVKLMRRLQHRNLVRLIGCRLGEEDDSRFLVYEYVTNQSLDRHLFASSGRDILTWDKRREILVGVARGLTYLHHDSHLTIIHRDIKAANVLLDDDLNPKIADFGLAKLFDSDRTHMSTGIAGTLGYIAPEYALNGQVSMKSDVFSFGLLMLEVISGRRVFEVSSPPDEQYLLHWTWSLHEEGRQLEILDDAIKRGSVEEEEVKRFIHVSLLCCQTSPSQRPSMLAVSELLVNLASGLDIPTMPTHLAGNNMISPQYA